MFPYGGVTLCEVSILRPLVDMFLLLASQSYSMLLFYYCVFVVSFLFVESGANRSLKFYSSCSFLMKMKIHYLDQTVVVCYYHLGIDTSLSQKLQKTFFLLR